MNDMEQLGMAVFSQFSSVLKLDLTTAQVTFLKSAVFHEFVGHTMDADHFGELGVATGKIHKDDLQKIRRIMDIREIEKTLVQKKPLAPIFLRLFRNGKYVWNRMMVLGDSSCAYIVAAPVAEHEATEYLVQEEIYRNCYLYSVINLDSEEHWTESAKPTYAEHLQGVTYTDRLKHMCDNLVHPEDAGDVYHFLQTEHLRAAFDNGEEHLQIYYRRKVGVIYRWVMCRLSRTEEYAPGNRRVILMVNDINTEMIQLINRQARSSFEELTGGSTGDENYTALIMEVIYILTEPYYDFFIIDSAHRAYVSFKNTTQHAQYQLPSSGSYDEQIRCLSAQLFTSESERKRFLEFASFDSVNEALKDRPTIHDTFTHWNGIEVDLTYSRLMIHNRRQPLFLGTVTKRTAIRNRLRITTFGNFTVYGADAKPMNFRNRKALEVLAYLVDRNGFDVTVMDIIRDVLDIRDADLNARKYASSLISKAMKTLSDAGYPDVIVKTRHSVRINKDAVDCDYYHLLNGEIFYWQTYEGEYMKEYSWAEETNSSIYHYFE